MCSGIGGTCETGSLLSLKAHVEKWARLNMVYILLFSFLNIEKLQQTLKTSTIY